MKTRYLLLLGMCLACVAVYFGSPYWAIYRLKHVVESGSRAELTLRIDFDAVREATKTELARATDERLKGNSRLSRAVTAGLGHMLAVAMISSAIDDLVTPDSLATLIERSIGNYDHAALTPASVLRTAARSVSIGRFEGANVFKVSVPDVSGQQPAIALVFTRSGWYQWRLSSIQFPSPETIGSLAAVSDSVS
jgi:Protein of unknown function (DUF2939)